jgi:hypothetical protein
MNIVILIIFITDIHCSERLRVASERWNGPSESSPCPCSLPTALEEACDMMMV